MDPKRTRQETRGDLCGPPPGADLSEPPLALPGLGWLTLGAVAALGAAAWGMLLWGLWALILA